MDRMEDGTHALPAQLDAAPPGCPAWEGCRLWVGCMQVPAHAWVMQATQANCSLLVVPFSQPQSE